MRAVLQRVSRAAVYINGEEIAQIGRGILILFGVAQGDAEAAADFLAEKIANLRIFADEQGKMNLSALQVAAEVLVVSQFTLYGDCAKGRRPSFDCAADPATAERLYERFVTKLGEQGLSVQTGRFQAHMQVELVNDGPVTFIIER